MVAGEFRFWCQKVLPLTYDDSLSYYELLCKVVKKLNELAENNSQIAEAIVQLKEYVDNYFNSTDFTEIINNKLDEMASDGTLADLINDVIFGELDERVDNLESAVDVLSTKNIVPNGFISPYLYGYLNYDGSLPTGEQHVGAVCRVDTTEYIISSPRSVDTSNNGVFRKVSVVNNSDDLTSIKSCKLGHANSMCYYESGKLLVAPVFDYSGGSAAANYNLYVITTEGVYVTSIPTSVSIMAVSRDWTTNKVYAFGYDGSIWEVSGGSLVATDMTYEYEDAYNQDIAVYAGICYYTAPWGSMKVFDMATGTVLQTYEISSVDSSGNVTLGELDGMEFDIDGRLFVVYDARTYNSTIGFICQLPVGVNNSVVARRGQNPYTILNRTATVDFSNVLRLDWSHIKTPDILFALNQTTCIMQIIASEIPVLNVAPNVKTVRFTNPCAVETLNICSDYLELNGTLTLTNSIRVVANATRLILNGCALSFVNEDTSIFSANAIGGTTVNLTGGSSITNGKIGHETFEQSGCYIAAHGDLFIRLNDLA